MLPRGKTEKEQKDPHAFAILVFLRRGATRVYRAAQRTPRATAATNSRQTFSALSSRRINWLCRLPSLRCLANSIQDSRHAVTKSRLCPSLSLPPSLPPSISLSSLSFVDGCRVVSAMSKAERRPDNIMILRAVGNLSRPADACILNYSNCRGFFLLPVDWYMEVGSVTLYQVGCQTLENHVAYRALAPHWPSPSPLPLSHFCHRWRQ